MSHTSDKIFVSYSRHDEAFARKMAVWLAKTLNLGVWIDVDDIQPGIKWSAAIQDGLDNCEVMVVIVTPEAMKSVNVEDEWQYFIDLGKPVVPILLRSAPIPYQLRRIQYIDFSVRDEYNESLRLLIVELRRHLKPLNSAEREEASRSTGTMHRVSGGAVTQSKKAVRNKERMDKAEDLLLRQEKALQRNNMLVSIMGFLVFVLAIGFGGFAYYVYINQPHLFYIHNPPSDAVAYVPGSETPVPVSSLNGQAQEGTRFETGDTPLELTSEGGAEAVIQADSSATIDDFSEEKVEVSLQEGNVSLDTAGMEGEINAPNGISISAEDNIEVAVNNASNEISASCYEGSCTISDTNDGRSRELEEGSIITFSSTELDFDTAVVLNIPGAIVFVTFRHSAAELYLATPQGTNLTRLTNNSSSDIQPVWSPDGTSIAFVTDRERSYDIAILTSIGVENLVTVIPGEGRSTERNPAWSPDGTRIAFNSDRDGNDEIYVMNADGSELTRLTNSNASDIQPAWSPDGTKIVFVSTRTGNPDVFIMDLADLEAEPLNISLNPAIDNEPAWSPDGTRIVYTSNRDNNQELYLFTLGQEPDSAVNISNNTSSDFEAAWSPDGTRIVFTSQRFGNNNILLMNADGSGELLNISGEDNTADEEANWLPILRAGQ